MVVGATSQHAGLLQKISGIMSMFSGFHELKTKSMGGLVLWLLREKAFKNRRIDELSTVLLHIKMRSSHKR